MDEVPTVSAKEPEVNDVEPPEALEAVSSYQENLYQPSMTNHTIDQQPPTLTNGLEQTPDTIELDQNSSSTQAIEHSDPPESDHRTPTPTAFTQVSDFLKVLHLSVRIFIARLNYQRLQELLE